MQKDYDHVLIRYVLAAKDHIPDDVLEDNTTFNSRLKWVINDLSYKDPEQQKMSYLWEQHCRILAEFVKDGKDPEAKEWEVKFWKTLTPWRFN